MAKPYLSLTLLCLLFFLPGLTTLPPLDRDEARFAQATKQMIETGDYIEIRFQDRARNKKPIGIYWLQAASAHVFAGPDHTRIWAYRLPSLLAAIFSVLTTFWMGRRAFGLETGLLSGALMASALLLVVEAGIAKTDAALLASILIAQAAAFHLYLEARAGTKQTMRPALVFWVALGVGVLIKGPVPLMVAGLTLMSLSIIDRNFRWLSRFKPWIGLPVLLAITLPWGIAVWIATDGAFFAEAAGKDFAPKLLSGQESHGAPPGYYTLLAMITLWPASLYLWPALFKAWSEKAEPQIRFLLCWLIPTWVVFEVVPTKLPHYVLPLYPALALMVGWLIWRLHQHQELLSKKTGNAFALLWALLTLLLAGLLVALPITYGDGLSALMIVLSLAVVLGAGLVVAAVIQQAHLRATLLAILTGLIFSTSLLEGAARKIPDLKVSPRLVSLLHQHSGPTLPLLGSTGFTEPSLVFLTRTDILLAKPEELANFLVTNPKATVLVESRQQEAFAAALSSKDRKPLAIASLSGVNYSRGDDVTLTLYRLEPVAPAPQNRAENEK
jgi:4-amino-4-deoxy-L-arabinose transferase-like glycosyltransferase